MEGRKVTASGGEARFSPFRLDHWPRISSIFKVLLHDESCGYKTRRSQPHRVLTMLKV